MSRTERRDMLLCWLLMAVMAWVITQHATFRSIFQ
jgi:hypothetical protein